MGGKGGCYGGKRWKFMMGKGGELGWVEGKGYGGKMGRVMVGIGGRGYWWERVFVGKGGEIRVGSGEGLW